MDKIITFRVNKRLKQTIDNHPEINVSELCRQAILTAINDASDNTTSLSKIHKTTHMSFRIDFKLYTEAKRLGLDLAEICRDALNHFFM
jgi:hypothetical protein